MCRCHLSEIKHTESSPPLQEFGSFKGRVGCTIYDLYRFFSGPLKHRNFLIIEIWTTPSQKLPPQPHRGAPFLKLTQPEYMFHKIFTLFFPPVSLKQWSSCASPTLNSEGKVTCHQPSSPIPPFCFQSSKESMWLRTVRDWEDKRPTRTGQNL